MSEKSEQRSQRFDPRPNVPPPMWCNFCRHYEVLGPSHDEYPREWCDQWGIANIEERVTR